jgi:hypothetical protein
MTIDPLKILYIGGWGRSGSTILGNILGSIDGFFFVGESRLAEQSVVEGEPCGCGASLNHCEVWKTISRAALPYAPASGPGGVFSLGKHARTRHLPVVWTASGRRRWTAGLSDEVDRIDRAYREIQSAWGVRVIVDSSKAPGYARMLEMVPSAQMYVVHLVRDPRASAYSWRRRKLRPNQHEMPRRDIVTNSFYWNLFNLAVEKLWARRPGRYMMLRYEDLIAEPVAAVDRVLQLIGESRARLPFAGPREARIGVSHTVNGNPLRMQSGVVRLSPDEEWRVRMGGSARSLVTALTWPLRRRYGYAS